MLKNIVLSLMLIEIPLLGQKNHRDGGLCIDLTQQICSGSQTQYWKLLTVKAC